MYGIDLDIDGVEPLPDTCLSCRRKLKRDVKLDMGLAERSKPITSAWPFLHEDDVVEDKRVLTGHDLWDSPPTTPIVSPKHALWGASILETIKAAGKVMDYQSVPTEGRLLAELDEEKGEVVVHDLDAHNEQVVSCDVVEWMEARDSIDKSFISLMGHARRIKAFHMESRLLELHRELLALISAGIDDEDDDKNYSLGGAEMP